jgi:hypothetical protein
MLMLGDNGYLDGTDSQLQGGTFDIYTDTLSSTGMWSTIGNHEMGTSGVSVNSDPESYIPASGEPGRSQPHSDTHFKVNSYFG